MRNKGIWIVLSVLLVSGLLMGSFGCAAPATKPTPTPSPTSVAPITLKLGAMLPIGNTYRNITDQWAKEIGEITEGRLTIETFQFAELGMTGFDTLSAMKTRPIDMGCNLLSYLGSEYPPLGAIELPYLCNNREEAWAGEAALLDWAAPKLREYKVMTIGPSFSYSPALFIMSEEVKTLDDFKGLKIRVYSPELGDLVTGIDATPVAMPFGDVYTALQRGIVEAIFSAVSGSYEAKHYEVVKYAYRGPPHLAYASSSLFIHEDAWNEIPTDLQEILQKETERHADLQRESSVLQDVEGYENWSKVGTVTEFSPEVLEKLKEVARESVWPGWIERVGPEGEEALEILLTTWGRD